MAGCHENKEHGEQGHTRMRCYQGVTLDRHEEDQEHRAVVELENGTEERVGHSHELSGDQNQPGIQIL